ncbi:MAG: undecaprenyl-diphosphatase [Rhodobacterales bacterium 34-62-10]|nr:MAG: undecaprenyl-diphosphatase [Rhodobacterales bacterium 34-62-10]
MLVYATKLVAVFAAAPHDPQARRTILSVLIAFLPAVVVGVLAHDIIKTILFESPRLIAVMLILGGVVLLVVDRTAFTPRYNDAMHLPLSVALKIGLFQCLAMIPGVSRSGATIVGALTLGASKRAAAEFSFFLSMPTMAGAFAYDLWQNRAVLDSGSVTEIAIGFAAAFVVAVVVVRGLLSYVSRYGYALFGWWRIIVGSIALLALTLQG